MSNKQLMIVELSPEHAIGLQHTPLARDALFIQGIKKAIVKLHTADVDVIVLDFGTHGGPQASSPVDACRQLTAARPNAKIIAIGATDDYLAGQLLLPNIYDVLAYPSDTQMLAYAVQRARRLQQIRLHNISLTKVRPLNELIPGLMSSDAAMRRVVKRARRLLGHNLRILIQGEPGTGRKTLAHYFAQYNGHRPGTDSTQLPPVPMPPIISCSRYTRGIDIEVAFRQASTEYQGAGQPIIILENIEQLDPTIQTELLYLIHNSETRWKDVNTLPQIISIASPALGNRIVEGQFRRDLYDRLGQVHLCLPPLRQRGDDARELAQWLLNQAHTQQPDTARMVLSDDALVAISRYSWHGNVTELRNIIQQAILTTDSVVIQASDLGLPANETLPPVTIKHARDEAERDAIIRALKDANDNIAKAALTLGVSRPTLYDLLAKHHMR
ncbi:MAG: sigma 54-interacting transcriptional regulator [Lautropia sp.]|nr:sigma 54-interacting transcriptional regulator [Lautropia sp.]